MDKEDVRASSVNEFLRAKSELQMAEQDFNFAENNFLDTAIFRLNAALARYDAIRGKRTRYVLPWLKDREQNKN